VKQVPQEKQAPQDRKVLPAKQVPQDLKALPEVY